MKYIKSIKYWNIFPDSFLLKIKDFVRYFFFCLFLFLLLLLLLLLLFLFFLFFCFFVFFVPIDSPLKIMKNVFYFMQNFFLLSRYSIFAFQSSFCFLLVGHCFKGLSKISLKVHDVINCLSKKLLTHFIWNLKKGRRFETLSIDRVLNKEHFYGKMIKKMCTQNVPDPS